MNKCFRFAGLPGLLLILVLSFTGCSTPVTEDTDDDPSKGKAPLPVITVQPTSIDYLSGDTPAPLTVTATVSGGGILTYQWYGNTSYSASGGTAISGAVSASYTPPVRAEAYYYAVITNTAEIDGSPAESSLASSPARIRILESAPDPLTNILTVNTVSKYQYVRGFGGMANVWTSPDMTVRDIETMFNPVSGLGLNILRICLYPYMDDIINNIEIPERDNSDYYDLVKRVNRYNGYVLASPWTPPAEWKNTGDRNGGSHLLPAYYGSYANHLKEFCQRMYDNGAPIYAVSIQNEPNYEANYDGCEWLPEDQRKFFAEQGRFTGGVKGWGGGVEISSVLTMTGEVANTVSWNNAAMNDPAASANIDLVGYHIYGSLESRYAAALDNATRPKETWMTEHNINTAGNYPVDSTWGQVWRLIDEVHHCIAVNDSSAFIWWYAKRFYSFIGDGEYGTVDGQPLWRGWAMSHYAKYASDTRRVGLTASGISGFSGGATSGRTVMGTAYESMDGNSIRLVIYNKGSSAAGDIQINLPDGFTANGVSAIITDGNKKAGSALAVLSRDGKSGVITLPASAIMSVKFTKGNF
jgi:O-glycosyl hydrolase